MARRRAPPGPPPPSPARLWRRRAGRGLAAAGILAFGLASLYVAFVVVSRVDDTFFPGNELPIPTSLSLPRVTVVLPGVQEQASQETTLEGRINFLVLGLDTRPPGGDVQLRGSKLTDTIIVVSVDPASKTASIIGIPRDLYVEIPLSEGEVIHSRINMAYECGLGLTCREEYADGGGPGLAMATIERNLGIRLDHYLVVDWQAFQEFVDSLGGIWVDVPESLGPPPPWNDVLDVFPDRRVEVGLQHFNGAEALGYSRYRGGPDADYGRVRRQQQVLFALMDRIADRNLWNPAELQKLWSRFKDTIETDVNDLQVPGLALLASDLSPERVSAFAIAQEQVEETSINGAAVLLPREEAVAALVQEALADPQIRERGTVVEIRNGSGRPDAAVALARRLRELGFPGPQLLVDETPAPEVSVTRIAAYGDDEYTLRRLLRWLDLDEDGVHRAGEGRQPETGEPQADIVITVGADLATTLLAEVGEDTAAGGG